MWLSQQYKIIHNNFILHANYAALIRALKDIGTDIEIKQVT